jgi:hypothetical protein
MPDNPLDPSSYMDPGPLQLGGPGMEGNNAMVARQAAAQAAIRRLLLQRAMQGMQGGMPMAPPPQMLGAPPVRPMAPPPMMPGQPPFEGGRG